MKWTIGIDEAGRGPLAGPVAVGAFAVPESFKMENLEGIRDSKKLSAKQRGVWEEKILGLDDIKFAVAYSSEGRIDQAGIVPAIEDALTKALFALGLNPEDSLVLLDGGLKAPSVYTSQKTIIKGDVTEPVISAAAILAKERRDKHIIKLAKEYPVYGFEKHKGYGTKQHREAILAHGLCPIHRRSFCKNFV